MNRLLFFFFCTTLFVVTNAQNNYTEAIKQGDDAFNKGQYKMAINKYFAAEAFDPSKKESVKAKVNMVFDKIESLRKKAEEAEHAATKAKTETDKALAKADKFIKAIYFYKNRFALTQGDENGSKKFFFIDKNGDKIIKLSSWDDAKMFNEKTGFASVGRNKPFFSNLLDYRDEYLLDTLGNSYKVVHDTRRLSNISSVFESLSITALDLSLKQVDTFPTEILKHPQLKVLIINGMPLQRNNLKTLPAEINILKDLEYLGLSYCHFESLPLYIEKLTKLSYLDLTGNKLKSFPDDIGDLKKLKRLNLKENPIPKTEQEKIKKLLPDCQIEF